MVIVKQFLSPQVVARMRDTLTHIGWQDGKQSAMGMASDVKNNWQADREDPKVLDLANQLLSHIGTDPQVVAAALPNKIYPPCFNRFAKGQTYGNHVDAAIMRLPDSQQILRSDVSMTVFLSDPGEYKGGELVIVTPFGEQTIKLSAGDAVVYPSSSLHRVAPVTDGERIAAICWMQSLVSEQGVRETLYQLDRSIQSLSASAEVDREQLDNLHHVYHNLIRHHSQI